MEFSIGRFTILTLVLLAGLILLGGVLYFTGWFGPDLDEDTANAPHVVGSLSRFATTAYDAGMTGPHLLPNGNPVFSLQHPSRRNLPPNNMAGVVVLQNFDLLNETFEPLQPPRTMADTKQVQVAAGDPDLILREGDNLAANQDLGIPTTPTGLSLEFFHGSRHVPLGYTPDMNQFVATDDGERQGYLFTNFESSPGNITRVPLRLEDGRWKPNRDQALNLANHRRFRTIGGTRMNCYGDLSPWGTPLSAEEEFTHPYVSMEKTVSAMNRAGTGKGYVGAGHFWNRPNPSEIQNRIDEYFWFSSWNVHGSFALGGIELLAYHLGAEPVDQIGNPLEPIIGDEFPNKYRYGYIVDIRRPADDDWRPVKYYVMGRFAPESPEVLADRKTVYLTSDGSFKGLYKFVSNRPIPSYSDPMNITGTLYVARAEGPVTGPPANQVIELDWVELGTASNREVRAWIEDYDHVDQQTYLSLATRSGYPARVSDQASISEKLEAADRYVVKHGNPAFLTPQEIHQWANQYRKRGPDGVDEDLRRVPFLETRAAAREVGGTIEWRKAEGIDSRTGSPGDYIYIGISEVDPEGMSDQAGDLRLERVEGGVVYRAKIDKNYNINRLEPVVVGPDESDPAEVAEHAVVNVDNVYVMPDGRVLLLEDAHTLGRSHPNDHLWVYTPPEGPATNSSMESN